MNRKTIFLIAVIVILLGLLTAFQWLDFRLMRGLATDDAQTETYAFGIDGQASLPPGQKLDLYVVAAEGLDQRLAEALSARLESDPFVGDVVARTEAPTEVTKNSLLLIEVEPLSGPRSVFWSPVYARAWLSVQVAYASDGQVAWIDQEVIRLTSSESAVPVVRLRASHEVTDTSYGLISRPGYDRYLGGRLAEHIGDSLIDQLANYSP